MDRAYSLLTLKALDEDKRILHGIATTPAPDRMDDIVEPKGAEFTLPIPFLWQHNSREPVGKVTRAKVTKDGIDVEIHLAKTDEPGKLKERLDEAWQSIKMGLVRGLSIGFKALELSRMDGGGHRFIKWAWLELSAVTIAANADATITSIKSLDSALLAAAGRSGNRKEHPPGGSGKSVKLEYSPKEGGTMKTISEQIKGWEATRAAKVAKRDEILAKCAESDETPDEAQQQEIDEIKAAVEKIDRHLDNLRDVEKDNLAALKEVKGGDPDEAGESRGKSRPRVQVITDAKLEPGTGLIRYAICMHQAKNNPVIAAEVAKARYPEYAPIHRIMKGVSLLGTEGASVEMMRKAKEFSDFMQKAGVSAGTTTDSDWASALVELRTLASEFLEYLRPQTIVDKFGTNGIPALRMVPFNVRVPRQISRGRGYWVGQGKGKPVTSWKLDDVELRFNTVAAIAVITKQLARFSNPAAEAHVRKELTAAVIERLDRDFVDPAKTLSGVVSPASITNGAATAASSGDDIDDVKTDLLTIYAEFNQANINRSGLVYITNQNIADSLALMTYDLGNPAFPGVADGRFFNRPLIASQWVPEGIFIALDTDSVLLADDGTVAIDVSEEASLHMDDATTQASDVPTATSVTSLWQTNSIGIRAEREITWLRGRDEGVFYLTSVNWGGTAGSGDVTGTGE